MPAIAIVPKLKATLFRGDDDLETCLADDRGRINETLNNSGDHVTKIQSALKTLDGANLDSEAGTFGPSTTIAVKKYKNARNLLRPPQKPGQADGTVGKGTMARLDRDMVKSETTVGPLSGAVLARRDAPFATQKVDVAIQKLNAFATALNARLTSSLAPPAFDPVTVAALRTHFRLSAFGSTAAGPRRPVNTLDIAHILLHFTRMRAVFLVNATSFVDGTPVGKDGKPVPAASQLNSSSVIFGSHFRNFTNAEAKLIGPNSRAAILIHEGFHSVDFSLASGRDDIHISEFSPSYDTQAAGLSLFNPSSFAGFAAHVFPPGRDPKPRFGLGAGQPR